MKGATLPRLMNDQNIQNLDQISELPDSILLHILSFTPTKVAVSTSLLSKRWMNLWIDLPVLDFDWEFKPWIKSEVDMSDYERKKDSFENFVDRVLHLNRASHITRCRFSNLRDFHSRILNAWLSALSLRQVREILVLNFFINIEPFCDRFTFKIFMLESLYFLDLSYLHIKYAPKMVHIRLPNLKTLHLQQIVTCFNNDFFDRLVAGCPILQELVIISCHFYIIEIHSLTLNTLKISNPEIPQTVILDAPDLKWLSLYHVNLCYKGSNIPSLTKAIIHGSLPSLEILKGVSRTSTLHLDYYGRTSELDCENLPQFDNLTFLKMEVYCAYKLDFILDMVNHCPNLQNFILHFDCYIHYRDWTLPDCVPQCLLSSLKVFQLRAYDLRSSDVEILNYILRNGTVLEDMKLGDFKRGSQRVLKKLLMPHKSSSACTIMFT